MTTPIFIDKCYCCPDGFSRNTSECMQWRAANFGDRAKRGAAGRYPVDKPFPCELCGKIEAHRHDAVVLLPAEGIKKNEELPLYQVPKAEPLPGEEWFR